MRNSLDQAWGVGARTVRAAKPAARSMFSPIRRCVRDLGRRIGGNLSGCRRLFIWNISTARAPGPIWKNCVGRRRDVWQAQMREREARADSDDDQGAWASTHITSNDMPVQVSCRAVGRFVRVVIRGAVPHGWLLDALIGSMVASGNRLNGGWNCPRRGSMLEIFGCGQGCPTPAESGSFRKHNEHQAVPA